MKRIFQVEFMRGDWRHRISGSLICIALVSRIRLFFALLCLFSAGSGGVAATSDPCEDDSKKREYNVSAIDVKMVLNRFGDRDNDAFMYVLDKNIQAVRKWENLPGCTVWNQPGKPKEHQACVSHGLRKDLVQPLVLRVNLGQCLVINFTNRLDPDKSIQLFRRPPRPNDGKASIHINGLAHSAENAGGHVGFNDDTFACKRSDNTCKTSDKITYKIPIPTDPSAERAYYFYDGGANRNRRAHGLFGAVVVEPAESKYLDPQTGKELKDSSGWEAIIAHPKNPDFREFVLIYHEIGDEDFFNIIDGTLDNKTFLDQLIEDDPINPNPVAPLYRPSARAINYRSESFHHRLEITRDGIPPDHIKQQKALGYSSYTFGDPATPIPRSYLGEPTKTRLLHGGSEVFHVHHLHGGGDRWRRNPKSDPNNDISSRLNKRPQQDVFSTHLDSQSIGPGTSYNLEHECGAGGCQQAAGDFLYHCHIGQHYIAGMWGFWRVFDTKQTSLAKLPDMTNPPEAVDSIQLIGKTIEGKTIVAEDDPSDFNQVSLNDWVKSQLPPQGKPLDHEDATVWNWATNGDEKRPIFLGEPETVHTWANYTSTCDGGKTCKRPKILFNPNNGRYAWPLFQPHLGQRPPFSPNGHSGAPWLGEQGSGLRLDGLCPDPDEWKIPVQRILYYPISAVSVDIPITKQDIDEEGKLFVLNEDIRGKSPSGKAILSRSKALEPLTIRSNVGDCVNVIFTSQLQDNIFKSRVNMHTHFVQFDPQASDGVITGFSYEQSVRPFSTERWMEGVKPLPSHDNEKQPRQLVAPVAPGAQEISVNQAYRLLQNGKPRKIWIGIGLGEGIIKPCNTCDPNIKDMAPRTEIRRIIDITSNSDGVPPYTIKLDEPLQYSHEAGESVGVEFVQYAWYSDVDTGTVFWHDHVDFNSWDHGLVSAHIIEPAYSTWHDPKTGITVRSGNIVDIHMPASASIGAGQEGSFREFMLFNHKKQSGADGFGFRKASINLKKEPIVDPRAQGTNSSGRKGDAAYWFSSIKHGDPFTPLPRAYVGDPFMIRHIGVMDRVGAIRVTGHRFPLERFAKEAALSDGSPIGISERYDLLMDGGAGGPSGQPGDFLYYATLGRDMLGGAWGLIRVHDTYQHDLRPLPEQARQPRRGAGFPSRIETSDPCPLGAQEKKYDVHIGPTEIIVQDGQTKRGVAYTLQENLPKDSTEPNMSIEPLVLRVNHGECLVVDLTNDRQNQHRAGLHVGELLFDPQGSYGAAIGLNHDSTLAPGQRHTYRYYADKELGTTIAFNLANPNEADRGAFAAVVVEPKGSKYRTDPGYKAGIRADILDADDKLLFREFVTLFHDSDPFVGHNDMLYPWEAHCLPYGDDSSRQSNCKRDQNGGFPVGSFTAINYAQEPWALRNSQGAPSDVYSSKIFGDPGSLVGIQYPGSVVEGPAGMPLMFRVASPWAEQVHVFSLSGHRWPLEPDFDQSEQVFSRMLPPGYAFDAPIIGGFGGPYRKKADFLFFDARMPFAMSGLWGLIRVTEEPEEFDDEE